MDRPTHRVEATARAFGETVRKLEIEKTRGAAYDQRVLRSLRLAVLLAAAAVAAAGAAQAAVDAGPKLDRLEVPRDLRVVSYYPTDAGWTRMWEPWRPQLLAADLRRLRSLNANAVRIVVPANFVGYPVPEERYLDRLNEFVAIAARNGLRVQLTLFDWWGSYRDLAGSKEWARSVLERYVGDARIAFVELRNEIDPADAEAVAWTRALVPWLRDLLDEQTPVTVSVGGMEPARDLRTLVAALPINARPDFFDAHYFTGGGEQAQQVFSTLRTIAAPTAVWIGELGYPTSTTLSGYPGVPLTASAQEAAQAHYFKLCFSALARLGLPAPGIWILDDFAPGAIPRSEVDDPEPEYRFGLFRGDGSAKPAALTVRRLFAGRLDTGFNGGFEAVAAAEDGVSVPAVWGSTGELRLVRDSTVARSGLASARIVGRSGGSGTFLVSPVTAPVQRGPAELSAWVRGTNAALRVAIVWFGRDGTPVGQRSTSVRAGPRWRRAAVVARPPAPASFARIVLQAHELQGSLWLDDVSFAWR